MIENSQKGEARLSIAWLWRQRFALVYVALAVSFVFLIARFYVPQTGFSQLIVFGDRFAARRLTGLRDVPVFTYRNSYGYDGQFYAQIAVAGNPFDPELRTALDSPAYRSGRILLPVLAHLAGWGDPAAVLTVYALSNVLCWLILAWIAARWWFPPTSLDNLIRWSGTLFGAGMLSSVTRSLTDGPALLLVAVGVRCLERNRRWLAAGVLGACGLVREMSVLATVAFAPRLPFSATRWRRDFLAASICVLPPTLWGAILSAHYGAISTGGTANLGIPFVAFVEECKTLVRMAKWSIVTDDVYVVVAVSTQVVFMLARPRPALAWWRIGTAFAVFALFIGHAQWEEPHMAIARTLLPLTLAFNVLVPRTRRWLAILMLGNLSVLSASRTLDAPPRPETAFLDGITCTYVSGWHALEHRWTRTWRWSSGSAVLQFHNPTTGIRRVNVEFELLARTARTVALHTPGAQQAVFLPTRRAVRVRFGPFELPPGDTPLALDTTEPPWIGPGPGRPLGFSLQDLWLSAEGTR